MEPVPYAKLSDPQSLNLYAYVGNNPLIHVDADGHECISGYNTGDGSKCPGEGNANGQQAQQNANRQPDGSYKATPAQLAEIQDAADKKKTVGRNDQCVSACEHFTGVPGPTSSWRGGNLHLSSLTRRKVPQLPLS